MIKELIVVEGINDTKRLQSFFDVETIETHGLGLKKEIIELIKKANEKRGVILFLDPDIPGEKIRRRLNDEIPGLKNAFILKEDGRTKKKVGIEHASKEVLEEALQNLVTYTDSRQSLSLEEFYVLGLAGADDSASRREKVYRRFHLGKCNGKTLFKRLNMLGIEKAEIEKIL
ncbi:MAG: ribonuclease M5 [Erysipelotrichaceae bacterium]|jgi:ribonuclease M5|nr:ribonuclease M5 [Erysipelotrichaceae bacterium]